MQHTQTQNGWVVAELEANVIPQNEKQIFAPRNHSEYQIHNRAFRSTDGEKN